MKLRTRIKEIVFTVGQTAFAVLFYIYNYQTGLDMLRDFSIHEELFGSFFMIFRKWW